MLFQHLDPTIPHFVAKSEVIFAGFIDPENIVKQQRVTVGRRQSFVRKTGPRYHDSAQFADFRVHAERGTHNITAALRRAMDINERITNSGQTNRSHVL
jgi:hypothetical protein